MLVYSATAGALCLAGLNDVPWRLACVRSGTGDGLFSRMKSGVCDSLEPHIILTVVRINSCCDAYNRSSRLFRVFSCFIPVTHWSPYVYYSLIKLENINISSKAKVVRKRGRGKTNRENAE